MGKPRVRMMIPADSSIEQMEKITLGSEQVQLLLEGKTVRKVICVPGRLVNIVAN
jgi:leucyl-tRNA synthetase